MYGDETEVVEVVGEEMQLCRVERVVLRGCV